MTFLARSLCLLLVAAVASGVSTAPAAEDVAVPRRRAAPAVPHAARLPVRSTAAPNTASKVAPAPRAASAPVNDGGFQAISGNGMISPSDTTGAAGDTSVVTAVNVEWAVWSKEPLTIPAAPSAPLAAGTLVSLFPNLGGGGFVYDPKVVYDHYRDRHVLVFLSGQGSPFSPGPKRSRILIVAIPDATASDASTWCRRSINGDQIKKDGKQFADYPGLGFDQDNLYVTTNQFVFGGPEEFEYTQILAIGKSRLYNCQGKLKTTAFGGPETALPGGDPAFTIQPAITETELGFGKTEYLVSFDDRTCGAFCGKRVSVWRIKRTGKGLDLTRDSVNVPKGVHPPPGTQRDGSPECLPFDTCWDAGDLRLVTAFYDADRSLLYTAHAVGSDIGAGDGYIESAVRWYEIDPAPIKKSRLVRTGLLGEPQRDSGWPAVVTDAGGTLFVSYSRAGAPAPGEYISSVVSTIPPGATSPDATVVLSAGEARYLADPGRPQRWGDYSAANRDPVDPLDVWVINQYAKTDGTPPTTNLWQQDVWRLSAA